MLDQSRVDNLLALLKKLTETGTISFPSLGFYLVLDAVDFDEKEQFKIDVNRKGKRKPTKCTYQMRYEQTEILLRVDLDGPPHDNPDGETIPCPHLHIYRERFADRWAIPLPLDRFPKTTDIVDTMKDFLQYCKIVDIPEIQRPIE